MIDVFKIGVSLSMTSNSHQVLGVLLQDLLGVRKGAAAAVSGLSRVKLAAIGAGAAMAGLKVARGLWEVVDAGKDLNTQLELMKNRSGDFAAQLDQIRRTASQVSLSVPTSTPSENVKMVAELGGQIGVGNAQNILPMVAQLQHLLGKDGNEGRPEDIQTLLKVIENRGKLWQKDAKGDEIYGSDHKPIIDMASVTGELTAAWKAIAAQGGMLTPDMLLQLSKQGALAVGQQSTDVFYNKGGEAAVSQGASKVGTALASLASQFEGGVMTEHVAAELQRLGFLHQGEWKTGRGGHITVDAAARERNQEVIIDPYKWAKDTLIPKLRAMHMDQNQMSAELTSLLGRQTTQRAMNEFLKNPGSFDRASENASKVHGIDESYRELQSGQIATNLVSLTSALKGFGEELTVLAAPTVIAILHGMTEGIHFLTTEVLKHPTFTKDFLEITAGVSGFVAIVGVAVMATAIVSMTTALIPFVALAGAVTAMALAVMKLPSILRDIIDFVNGVLGITPPRTDNPRGGNQGHGSLSGDPGHGGGYDPDYPAAPPDTGTNGRNLHFQGDGSGGGRRQGGQSRLPPPSDVPNIHLSSYIMLDGRQIARVVSTHQADALSRPPSSRTDFDGRMHSFGPGQMVRA